jgi:hypothetical protein
LVAITAFDTGALAAPRPQPGGTAKIALSALQSICLGGDTSPAAVLARADAAGWVKTKPEDAEAGWDPSRDRSLQVGATVFMVDVWSIDEKLIHEDSCSIATWAETTGWKDAAQQWLDVRPTLVLGPAATYNAIRTETGWRAATGRDASNGTTSQGLHYNFVASDGVRRGDDHVAAVLTVDHFRGAKAGS